MKNESVDEVARMFPVHPPTVNNDQRLIGLKTKKSWVAIHLKIFILVGIAIIIVACVKWARVSIRLH